MAYHKHVQTLKIQIYHENIPSENICHTLFVNSASLKTTEGGAQRPNVQNKEPRMTYSV